MQGVTQSFFGATAACIFELAEFFNEEFREATYYGKIHLVHGIANIAQSSIESIPGVNLITIFYDANPTARLNYRSFGGRSTEFLF